MSDQTDPTAMLAALQAQLAALQRAAPAAYPAPVGQGGFGFAPPPVAQPVQIMSVLVPITFPTQAGEVTLYISLPPECAQSADAMRNALAGIEAAGYRVKAWAPKEQSRFGGGGNSFGGGGRRF